MRLLIIAALLSIGQLPNSAAAQTIAGVIETHQPYDLSHHNGKPPRRKLRFWIGENSDFSVCGKCLCFMGKVTARYPQLGIKATSGSPTFDCERDSREFSADEKIASQFMKMKHAHAHGPILVFSNGHHNQMVFALGSGELTPPD